MALRAELLEIHQLRHQTRERLRRRREVQRGGRAAEVAAAGRFRVGASAASQFSPHRQRASAAAASAGASERADGTLPGHACAAGAPQPGAGPHGCAASSPPSPRRCGATPRRTSAAARRPPASQPRGAALAQPAHTGASGGVLGWNARLLCAKLWHPFLPCLVHAPLPSLRCTRAVHWPCGQACSARHLGEVEAP